MILTLDLGTSVTKAVLWDRTGPVATASAPVTTSHPAPGQSEQDPPAWRDALVDVGAQLRARAGSALRSVEVIGCTGARQTFALVDADGEALGPAIVWSDRRAGAEAAALRRALVTPDGPPGPALDPSPGPGGHLSPGPGGHLSSGPGGPWGIAVDAGSVAAKIAWLAVHQRARLDAATWMLTPRDLVVWWLTGTVATDATMAWRSGLYDGAGGVVAELAGPATTKLAPVVPPDEVTGHLDAGMAGRFGLVPGIPVVTGAGDRACEVLGSGADGTGPMASWGTTANLSLPLRDRPDRVPPGLVVSPGAAGGWLLEGGLSGAGSLLDWLGRLTGRTPADLAALADGVAPGAGGVVATPWLDGARAPWWRDDARAALVGMSPSHGPAELARAVVESVAFDLQRCLEVMAGRPGAGAPPSRLVLGGAGASVAVWAEVVTAVTGLPAEVRGSGQAASAGAALLAARALGLPWELDVMDPVDRRIDAEPAAVRRYRALRPAADRVAASVLALGDGPDEPSKPPEGPEPACD